MTIGYRIPDILGIDQNGKEIKSSDYRGRKLVLYSYPKANTSGCAAEACSLQAHKAELAADGYKKKFMRSKFWIILKDNTDVYGKHFTFSL